ncbi:MAG: AGE family epimerase/isomerase [Acetanaerobacterium sp.]
MMTTQQLHNEAGAELNRLLAFWSGLRDERGGFYGGVDYQLNIQPDAVKSGILNNRILWLFSNAFLLRGDRQALINARHAYEFLRDRFVDAQHGGVYWMLGADGTPADEMKHSYNHAFAVYGLSSYFDASRDGQALQLAKELYRIIEERFADEYGYREAFARTWTPAGNDALSEDGYNAAKTMNTLLHLIEAYTELYRVSLDAEVGSSLRKALRLCLDKVYDRDGRMLYVFFDERMNSIADIYSYGHDIEATWLLDRACEILGDTQLAGEVAAMNREIAAHVRKEAFAGGALCNQRLRGEVDETRVWWVQAEGIVGFLNAYQRTGDKVYLDTVFALWEYIKEYMIDKRPGGEWYWSVDTTGKPAAGKPIVEPWKCPYHNGRMCMEVIKRCAKL